MSITLIFGKNSKIIDQQYFVNEKFFLDSRFSNQSRIHANNFKKKLEKTNIDGKNFLEFFNYDDISCWWFFSQETFFLKVNEIISFIYNFHEFLRTNEINEVRIKQNFLWKKTIEQICQNFDIPIKFSKSQYFLYLFKKNTIHSLKFLLSRKKNSYLKKHRIKIIKKCFLLFKKSLPIVDKKIVFVSPITYRRKLYNFVSGISEQREYLIDDLIEIGKLENTCGISVDFSHYSADAILTERFQSKIDWFPEEMILKYPSNHIKSFISNYNLLLENSQFQNLFKFNNIDFWELIKDLFHKMTFESYLPYWITLLHSLDDYYSKNKPQSIILTAEINANTLAHIFMASKHGVKTIRIQQAMITEKNTEFIHDCYKSENNFFGYPATDHMLVFGSFSKQILLKNGYPEKKILEFGNPTFAFLDFMDKLNKSDICLKNNIPSNKKIILFTTTKWQKDLIGEDLDPMIWKKLLKIYSNHNEYVLILKPHPGEKIEIYKQILSEYNSKNAFIIQDSLIELLHISDLVVSNYSSVIIDANCLNKPVLEIIWEKNFFENPDLIYHEIGITFPSKLENIEVNIKKLLRDEIIQNNLSKNRIRFLNEQYGLPIHRNSMKEVLTDLINST